MGIAFDKADHSILFTSVAFKNAVQDSKKYLGSKTGPFVISLVIGKKRTFIRVEQESPSAAAEIEIPKDEFELEKGKNFSVCIPEEWLLSFLRSSAKEKVRLLVVGSEVGLSTSNKSAVIRQMDHPTSMLEKSEDESAARVIRVGRFGKFAKMLVGLKSHYSGRPCAATYGVIDSTPFFMVNDQYHGSIAIGEKAKEENILLTTNAEAFRPMLEAEEEFSCMLEQGRLQMRTVERPVRKFWMPILDPSASPSQEEISGLIATTKVKALKVNAAELREALSIMTGKDEDNSTQFSMNVDSAGATLTLSFASATSSADAALAIKMKNIDKAWTKGVAADPRMLLDCLTRHSDDSVYLWVHDNVLFIEEHDDVVHRSFAILME